MIVEKITTRRYEVFRMGRTGKSCIHHQIGRKIMKLLYIDLFCGAGGTSTGVNAARLNY